MTTPADPAPQHPPVPEQWPPAEVSNLGHTGPTGATGATGATGPDLTDRMDNLTASSNALSTQVGALAEAVTVVGALQEKQDEFENELRLERERNQRNFLKAACGALLAMLLVAIGVYVLLLIRVDHLIDEVNDSAYTSCTNRNKAQMENADREQRLAELEDNRELRQLHATSAKQLRAALSDCSRWQD